MTQPALLADDIVTSSLPSVSPVDSGATAHDLRLVASPAAAEHRLLATIGNWSNTETENGTVSDFAGFAEEIGLHRAEEFARSWHILMRGSIISTTEGDGHAAMRATEMARDLIARHRRRTRIIAAPVDGPIVPAVQDDFWLETF